MKTSQIVKLVGAILAVVFIGVGFGVYSMVKSIDERIHGSPQTITSPLQDPSWLLPALEAEIDAQWLASARKLTLSSGSAELMLERDGVARRYSVAGNGNILRRGGAHRVAAEPFDLRTLDLGLVPQLVADAEQRTGVGVGSIVVGRDEQGLLLWRAVPSGEAADVYYTADGSFVPDPDDP